MFDTAPPNLPVEPTPQSSHVPIVPRPKGEESPTPKIASATANNRTGVKEPEDIFADIQEPEGSRVPNIGSRIPNPENRTPKSEGAPGSGGFPMKVVFGIGIPLVLLGLGIGGWYVYNSYLKSNKTISPPTNQNVVADVPVTSVPDNTPAETNPIPKPDEAAAAASQASMALLQAQASQGYSGENTQAVSTTSVTSPVVVPPPNVPLPIDTTIKTSPTTIGVDSDSDGLTNTEEALLGVSPNSLDSDNDGFADMSELLSGYDPASRGGKLNASANLKMETIGGLNVYVPSAWERKPGFNGSVQILTGTPAMINIDILPFSGTSLLPWVMYQDAASASDGYLQSKNAVGNDVVYSNDEMTAWLLAGDTVYKFKYDATGAETKDFGIIFKQVLVNQASL